MNCVNRHSTQNRVQCSYKVRQTPNQIITYLGGCFIMKTQIIKNYPSKNYTIIKREVPFEPYVACWKFDESTRSWGQGHYFETLDQAVKYVESL